MSRIAKKPIIIPAKTEVTFGAGVITVKGPLGTLTKNFRSSVNVAIVGNEITLTEVKGAPDASVLVGTYASHIRNMIAGVSKPYEKKLIIEGIGFKADVKGKDLALALGFSHPINLPIPADLKVATEKNTIVISGINCESVGQFAAKIRSLKKPEPYLGKGVRYSDEVVRRKQGKKTA